MASGLPASLLLNLRVLSCNTVCRKPLGYALPELEVDPSGSSSSSSFSFFFLPANSFCSRSFFLRNDFSLLRSPGFSLHFSHILTGANRCFSFMSHCSHSALHTGSSLKTDWLSGEGETRQENPMLSHYCGGALPVPLIAFHRHARIVCHSLTLFLLFSLFFDPSLFFPFPPSTPLFYVWQSEAACNEVTYVVQKEG